MGRLAQAVREAIVRSGISRYALARQVKTSESVLSRFMSNKQGITLETMERLADVLGLDLVESSGKIRKEDAPMIACEDRQSMIDKASMDAFKAGLSEEDRTAYIHACIALEFNRESHRGISAQLTDGEEGDVEYVIHFNNHPYADKKKREHEIAEIKRWLKSNGMKVVGEAYYPLSGKDAKYTYSMIIEMKDPADNYKLDENFISEGLREIYVASMTCAGKR
jgi:transcriptional regulator with XRE-family HTH domain